MLVPSGFRFGHSRIHIWTSKQQKVRESEDNTRPRDNDGDQ